MTAGSIVRVDVEVCTVSAGHHHPKIHAPVPMRLPKRGSLSILCSIATLFPSA